MANQTITQLNAAGAITGSELVPIVQNGQTVRTTTGAIAGSPSLTQTFLTVNNEPTLNNSRYLTSTGSGIGITDNGAQSTLALSLSTPLQTLDTSGAGLLAKTGSNTVTNRSIAVGGGLAVSNASGAAGNPTINLDGVVLALQNSSGTFLLGRTAGGGIATLQLLGTAGEIDVADGTGPSNPTIGLADNPVLPGTEGVVVPQGSTAQRSGSPTNGTFRYNNSLGIFEGYFSGTWGAIPAGLGVSSVTASTGLTSSPNPITSTGTISVATNGITDALLRQSSGLSVIGRSANSTGNVSDIAAASDHQVLRRSGSTVDFGAVNLAQANATTGTLPVTSGGTGQTSYTNGELLIGNSTGNTLTKATLTAGSNVTITNAAGSITIASSNPGGTVTSVGLSLPAEFTVTNSPVTGSGTLTGAWANANQAYFFAGPVSSTGTPTFRAIAVSDVPTLNQNTSGNAATATTATNVAGGAAGSLVYQTGAATTSTLALGIRGYVLRAGASAPEWAVIDGGTF